MDATTIKLIKKLREYKRIARDAERQARQIETALSIVGIRPEDHSVLIQDGMESEYAETVPFSHTTLVDACIRILADNQDKFLTKSHVEYLAGVGGYAFSTEDSKNSVAVTLRRLADKGMCEVKASRGPHGNEYRWIPGKEKLAADEGEQQKKSTGKSLRETQTA